MNLGEKIIQLRKKKEMSQEEMAEKLNVTRQTISKWETNQSTPDFDKVLPLCNLFGITTDELFMDIKKDNLLKDEQLDNTADKKYKTIGIVLSILLFFIAIVWIMISIPVLNLNPVVASAIFILICGIATCTLIYTNIMYSKEKVKVQEDNSLYKQIEKITCLITVIIYLIISFKTMAWHITWIIWIIYALVIQIIKLYFSIRGE